MTATQFPTRTDPATLRRILSHFCSGLTIVSTVVDDVPVGLTCQSFFSVSLEPPLVALSVGKSSTSFPAIRESEVFSVNVLAAHQRHISGAIGRRSADKWRDVDWSPGAYGQPILHGAIAWFECRLRDIHDAGDHEIVVAEVLDLDCDESAEPLLFFRSEYRELISDDRPHHGADS